MEGEKKIIDISITGKNADKLLGGDEEKLTPEEIKKRIKNADKATGKALEEMGLLDEEE
jgi:hypothetical protein